MNADRARELFVYDPVTGALKWRIAPNRRVQAGSEAGYIHVDGYRLIGVDRSVYRAHRVAWLLVTGAWPTDQIDHIDGDRANNRWANLREATNAQNTRNQRRGHRDGTTGMLGVSRHGAKYQAKITVDGEQKHLGLFDTAEEAHTAYLVAKRKYHG